ncbi:MAG TPA: ATP-binding protein [Actinocrinis sp.]|jgi:anti-sigma regulatory factor (Ser/Thr protein kinase)|uniref:ATP-binding protein n=1 Tax=Actinocrinis sp. TaxID=1920516 RepID=UPI002DDCB150|nr:ATP-binding protein [Actinocrinis sp.]HEV3169355.1 ATP-binding protein [Actinocrinis sp.]
MNPALQERTRKFDAPASATSVRRLRHRVAEALGDWGIVDRADDVIHSCAEILANALAHGQTEVLTVHLDARDGWLRLTVPDNNPYPPYPADADRDDEDGRGVMLMTALADAWGFRAADDGKCVFAEFDISSYASK